MFPGDRDWLAALTVIFVGMSRLNKNDDLGAEARWPGGVHGSLVSFGCAKGVYGGLRMASGTTIAERP